MDSESTDSEAVIQSASQPYTRRVSHAGSNNQVLSFSVSFLAYVACFACVELLFFSL